MSIPTVKITQMLAEALSNDGYDVKDYIQHFKDWKTDWPAEEYNFWFFGKNGEYKFPLRHGKRVMAHVHLPPELIAKEKANWEKADKHRSRKTSHNHLVYAGNATLNL